jgi:protease-4
MQDIVDQMLEQFIDVVATGRTNLTRNEIMNFADGRVYIAQDALEAGLIDEIGYFEDAVNVLAERAGVEEPAVIEFQKERNLKDIFNWALINIRPRSLVDIVNYNEQKNPYGMYFLWDGVLTSR